MNVSPCLFSESLGVVVTYVNMRQHIHFNVYYYLATIHSAMLSSTMYAILFVRAVDQIKIPHTISAGATCMRVFNISPIWT